jgi:hypothetical protein
MSSWSQNNSHGIQIQAGIPAKESDKQRIKTDIYTQLNRCKEIFTNQSNPNPS